jgi:hypothetical protein
MNRISKIATVSAIVLALYSDAGVFLLQGVLTIPRNISGPLNFDWRDVFTYWLIILYLINLGTLLFSLKYLFKFRRVSICLASTYIIATLLLPSYYLFYFPPIPGREYMNNIGIEPFWFAFAFGYSFLCCISTIAFFRKKPTRLQLTGI